MLRKISVIVSSVEGINDSCVGNVAEHQKLRLGFGHCSGDSVNGVVVSPYYFESGQRSFYCSGGSGQSIENSQQLFSLAIWCLLEPG